MKTEGGITIVLSSGEVITNPYSFIKDDNLLTEDYSVHTDIGVAPPYKSIPLSQVVRIEPGVPNSAKAERQRQEDKEKLDARIQLRNEQTMSSLKPNQRVSFQYFGKNNVLGASGYFKGYEKNGNVSIVTDLNAGNTRQATYSIPIRELLSIEPESSES